jgi:hypothetical protein
VGGSSVGVAEGGTAVGVSEGTAVAVLVGGRGVDVAGALVATTTGVLVGVGVAFRPPLEHADIASDSPKAVTSAATTTRTSVKLRR